MKEKILLDNKKLYFNKMWKSRFEEVPQDILNEILFKIPPYELYPQCIIDETFDRICSNPYFKKIYENYWIQERSDQGRLPLLITPDNFSGVTSFFQGGLGQRPKDVLIHNDRGNLVTLSEEELKILNQPINFSQSYLTILVVTPRNAKYYEVVTIPSKGVSIATILNIIANFYESPMTLDWLNEINPMYKKYIFRRYDIDFEPFASRELLTERWYSGINYLGADPENFDVAIIEQEID